MTVPWWVVPQSIVTTLLHGYLWWRLVHGTTAPRSSVRRLATVALAVLAASIPAALVAIHALSPAASRWFAWPGFVWYGLMIYLVLLLALAEPVRAALVVTRWVRTRRILKRRTGSRPIPAGRAAVNAVAPERRRFLARSVALAAGAAAVSVVGGGMSTALGPPRLQRHAVRLSRLPDRASGLRIALIGDLHLGAMLGRRHTERIVELVNRTSPDIVAIVGDLVDGTVDQLGAAVAPLARLRSRHGTFFVTGNHEYLFDADRWLDELRDLGVRPLQNERTELGDVDIAGVNDLTGAGSGEGPDYERALTGRDPRRPVVLLAHQPVQVHEAARRGVDLQLSGHTHGGQMVPFSLVTAAAQPTLAGWARHGQTQLYVTRGTGFWGPPVRVGASPEISVLDLST